MKGISTGTTVHPELIQQYRDGGWWIRESSADLLAQRAQAHPEQTAIVDHQGRHTWRQYHERAVQIGGLLAGLSIDATSCVAVQLDDSFEFHVALVAAERARVVALGVGARSEYGELAHLMRGAGAQGLITTENHRGVAADEVARRLLADGVELRYLVVLGDQPRVERFGGAGQVTADAARPGFGPDEFCLLNSTSGTTGLPKLVAHTANQWFAFANLARSAVALGADDVIGGFVPGPFGFGLWTTHYAPLLWGARTVITPRFTASDALRLIEAEGITMLACVSTQFKMILNDPTLDEADVSSLRVLYTGGEAVPFGRAREFEERTGALVLQFYGSNEAGAVSATTSAMTPTQRLATAGQVLAMMDVRRYGDDGSVLVEPGAPGQPGVRGPTCSLGYYQDPAANNELHSADGRLLLADVITVDAGGFVQVVGRKSDIIIRGGKNISAPQVEGAVEEHPAVALALAVAVPDAVFGERVCVVVETHDGEPLDLTALKDYLADTDLPRESWPEYVVTHAHLPRSSGGKLAKRQVREIALAALGLPT